MHEMDVAVLGGGPAGLAAALALRHRGCRVAVFDARHPPIDKTCGEGLMPESVRLLRELGVSLQKDDGEAFTGVSFHDGSSSVHGTFSSGHGMGVRRTRLHSRMAARAAEMEIALHWGAGVRALSGGGFAAAGVPIGADFFVIADGLCSTLAAASGFREQRCDSTRYACRQPFRCAPWSHSVEVHWGEREQLYVTPVGENEISVVLLTSARGRRLRNALPDFPAVARRLANVACTSEASGAITKTRTLRHVLRGNVAVLGDASGSVDAITGEGLLSAFRQALVLADAIAVGKPENYAAEHRRIARIPRRMARLLLLLDRYPKLRKHMIGASAMRPESFTALLEVHLGEESWAGFAMHQAADLLAGHSTHRHSTHLGGALCAASDRRERGL
jgi:menaquinone-9 beta-reductase